MGCFNVIEHVIGVGVLLLEIKIMELLRMIRNVVGELKVVFQKHEFVKVHLCMFRIDTMCSQCRYFQYAKGLHCRGEPLVAR